MRDQAWSLTILMLLLAGILGGADRDEWAILRSPDCSYDVVRSTLERLGPATENSSIWPTLINDSRRPADNRRICLFAFFRRHAPGKTLGAFFEQDRVRFWFAPDEARDASNFSEIPVERRAKDSVFMLRPNLPPGNDSALYLRVSGHVELRSILELLRGMPTAASKARIIEIGVSEIRS